MIVYRVSKTAAPSEWINSSYCVCVVVVAAYLTIRWANDCFISCFIRFIFVQIPMWLCCSFFSPTGCSCCWNEDPERAEWLSSTRWTRTTICAPEIKSVYLDATRPVEYLPRDGRSSFYTTPHCVFVLLHQFTRLLVSLWICEFVCGAQIILRWTCAGSRDLARVHQQLLHKFKTQTHAWEREKNGTATNKYLLNSFTYDVILHKLKQQHSSPVRACLGIRN